MQWLSDQQSCFSPHFSSRAVLCYGLWTDTRILLVDLCREFWSHSIGKTTTLRWVDIQFVSFWTLCLSGSYHLLLCTRSVISLHSPVAVLCVRNGHGTLADLLLANVLPRLPGLTFCFRCPSHPVRGGSFAFVRERSCHWLNQWRTWESPFNISPWARMC